MVEFFLEMMKYGLFKLKLMNFNFRDDNNPLNRKTARKSKGFFDTYFNTASSKARVVMVDAEPKVIKASLDDERQSKLSLYDPRNVVYSEVSSTTIHTT